ncbi:hypothetical protein BGZ80_007066 [Entomortierella chlamydospora]|uniref:Mediator of RNA polymerase II transcription subunit 4 n=1 Tax=Entomortierella chlamydospora TaxID=101097 RepID=A0A9P6MFM8_9FUNG|nr:hypothetical protein BGZ79_011023 [Entomortierella chlamydospora]KAF9997158.1 hypothetical protein BGZ80_007066 [Entomortierella chlamydospora]
MANSQHSLRQMVRNQITEYSRLTQTLFTSLELMAEGKVPQAQPSDIIQQIVQLDSTLMGAVEKIELHQKQQRKIRQVRLEIEEQNKAIMSVIQSLRDAKLVLEANLEDLEERRAITADARSAEVSVAEIVAYANRLSNYTSAPPNFNPSDPNHPFEPPYPREVSMRAGILNQQHIPAAALVSLDGGFMPGTAGQLALPGAGTSDATSVDGSVAGGIANSNNLGNNIHPLSNNGSRPPLPQDMEDEEDDDSGSSSEEEGFSLYGRAMDLEERARQERERLAQEQQQQQEDEDAADIFDLDLS